MTKLITSALNAPEIQQKKKFGAVIFSLADNIEFIF